jgi:beta-1,4-N-acetylglucosaminyltransferase
MVLEHVPLPLVYASVTAIAMLIGLRLIFRGSGRRTWVYLGGGGHTSEMLKLFGGIAVPNHARFGEFIFISSPGDLLSPAAAQAYLDAIAACRRPPAAFATLPRARAVGQSLATTPFTTLRSLFSTVRLAVRFPPSLIVLNGPGTCIPIAFVGRLWSLIATHGCRIAFFESYCRVTALSLTGRVVQLLAHRTVVHWPSLASERFPKRDFVPALL